MIISENVFLELSKKVQNLGFNQSLIEISKIAFEEMDFDRITVWKILNGHNLVCEFKEDMTGKAFKDIHIIDLKTFPIYSSGLHTEKILVANDVYNNNITFELSDHYKEQGICSALHIPIFVDGHLYGAVFFSTIDRYIFWKKNDIKFGGDISQIISIAYISSKRNEDITKLNAYAERVKTFNSELQEVIQKKNEQFIEYGFINSHLLNAPLSRLKGLLNILVHELNTDKREDDINFIVSKIYEEYNEMDRIIEKISILVEKGASPERDDIKG